MNLISDTPVGEEVLRDLESLENLKELGFEDGILFGQKLPKNLFPKIDDTGFTDKQNFTISFIPMANLTQMMMIKPSHLEDLIKQLNLEDPGFFSFPLENSPLEKQTNIEKIFLLTKDQENNIDGLFFLGPITQERDSDMPEAMQKKSIDAGNRFIHVLPAMTLSNFYIYGVAKTGGPLDLKEISITDYIKSWNREENYKKAKVYTLKNSLFSNVHWKKKEEERKN